MTFYKIVNNIIKISPPTGLLIQSHNRHHYIVPRSRLNTVLCILILPSSHPHLEHNSKRDHGNHTNRILSSSHKQTPFHHANSSKMLVTKPHSGIIVLMSYRLSVSWQYHTVVSYHTVSNLSPPIPNHTAIIIQLYIYNISTCTQVPIS